MRDYSDPISIIQFVTRMDTTLADWDLDGSEQYVRILDGGAVNCLDARGVSIELTGGNARVRARVLEVFAAEMEVE